MYNLTKEIKKTKKHLTVRQISLKWQTYTFQGQKWMNDGIKKKLTGRQNCQRKYVQLGIYVCCSYGDVKCIKHESKQLTLLLHLLTKMNTCERLYNSYLYLSDQLRISYQKSFVPFTIVFVTCLILYLHVR